MVIVKVANELPTPIWMDRKGNIVDEKSSFGCKVTHDITKPHCCFALDELDGNTMVGRCLFVVRERYLRRS